MKNKVLVRLIVPEIDSEYDIYLPINLKIGNIINTLNQTINKMSLGEYKLSNSNTLYNATTKEKYLSDTLVFNTNIRNGTVLVIMNDINNKATN